MISKTFKKLLNNKFVDHIEKYGLFSDFQHGFRSFSTANLLTVASYRIATEAVALDISNAFDRFWYANLFHKLKSY